MIPHQIAKAGSAVLETEGLKPLHSAAPFTPWMIGPLNPAP